MKPSNVIIAHPSNDDKLKALKAVMKALEIKFEVSGEKPYDPEFVSKILQGDKDIESGKGRKLTLDELDRLWK